MFRLILPLWLCLLAVPATLRAQEQRPPSSAPPAPAPAATPRPPPTPVLRGKAAFKSPGLGAPGARVDAATRGDGDAVSSLYVLAPNEVGATAQAQPTLFWYQTKPVKLPFEFSLLRPGEAKPVLALYWADGRRSGFQHLRLAEHEVSLKAGVDYQWVIALIRDPQNRSRDLISSGWIRRSPGAAPGSAWYDTVEALGNEIAAHPQDRQLRARRAALLNEAALETPARADLTRP